MSSMMFTLRKLIHHFLNQFSNTHFGSMMLYTTLNRKKMNLKVLDYSNNMQQKAVILKIKK